MEKGLQGVLFLATTLFFLSPASGLTLTLTSLSTAIQIAENLTVGSLVYNGTWFYDGSSTLVFNIGFGNQERRFSADASSFLIYLGYALDYETTKSYELWPRVTEVATGLVDSKLLVVNITDVNDNKPTCSHYNYLGQLSEDAAVGTSFTKLSCTDVDTGLGGVVEYSVVSGDTAYINVSLTTGTAYIVQGLNYESSLTSLQVVVQVSDKGSPRLSINVTVLLSVKDVDDNIPQFIPSGVYSTSVLENTPVGSSVLILSANDLDAVGSANSRVVYGISCSPAVLMVDRYTGQVFTVTQLDYETNPEIRCTATAYSSDKTTNTSTATVTITVIDVNDRMPLFNQSHYQGSVIENATVGTAVTAVSAKDPDGGTVTYSIVDTKFDIGSTSGVITLKDVVDYETATSHLLTVTATDNGTPAQTNTVFVQVTVTPVNEFDPVFTPPSYTLSVAEDQVPGTSVYTITASDQDAGLDGAIGYSLVTSTTPTPFMIDAGTGILRVAYAPLDFEKTKSYTFTIVAKDNSTTAPKSANASVTVTITDVNDSPVTCNAVPTVVFKSPFSNAANLSQLTCNDPDSTGASLTYSLPVGNGAGYFKIDSKGTLMLSDVSRRPASTRYDLQAQVYDGTDSTTVTFTVLSETDLAFSTFTNPLTIEENTTVGLLTTLSACCTFPQLTYTIVSGNSDNRVGMDSYTGNIYNNVPYDRELQGVYNYVVVATSTSGQSATATLTVSVQDINDHWPEFDRNIYVFKVDESLSVNSVISQITATDKDSGTNAQLTYALTVGTDSASFSIDAGTGSLSLIQGLDYEAKTTLTVEITAADGGAPPKSGTTTVVIQVQNKDESNPTWITLPGPYTSTLKEDVALGTLVFQVNATDGDMDTIFTYNITNGNTNNDFFIDPASGKVFVNKFLDRERTPSYTLTIVAVNQNGQSVTGTLTVNIQDVNDNYPKFSQNVYVYSFAHGYTGPNIGTLTVTDADEGTNAVVIGKILSGDTQSQFALSSSLQLTTSQSFDYLGIRRFTLVVEAEDGGSPKLTSTAVVVINVTPASTDAKFNITSDSVTLREDVLVGTQVYDFNATLLGALEDGTLKYTMSGGDGEFQIRPNTGQVYIASALDYEKKKESYNLVVVASTVKNSASCTLTVTITNINDNTPSFPSNIVGVTQETFSFLVDENATVGYVVGTVLATDADKAPYGLASETMTGTSDFVLDPTTGVITVKNKLNYLTKSYYNLLVTASDGGTPAKTAKAYVVIKVNDVNDHSPVFVTTSSTTLLDSVPIGSEVFRFYATDLDTGNAGNVSYVIKSTTGPGLFSLDESTGVLTTTDVLDAAVTSSYTLTITASDHGVPSLATDQTFTITLTATNPNYNTPIFSLPDPDTFTVPRTEPKGTVVGTKSATDTDHGISGQILYTILSGNDDGYFLMNETSGEIRTSTSILTAADSYTLVLRAKDRGTPSRSSTATVTINVTPSRTTNPDSDYSFTVAEDKPAGSEIGRIKVDSPRVPSGYTILAGNLGNSIGVDLDATTNEGLLTVSALDCEKYPEYNLLVEVTTDIGPLTKVVQVTVTDVNDNPPVFSQTAYVISIPENMPVGYTVETIMWSDADVTSANRNNNLTLTPPGDTYFTIDASGHLVIKKSPDYDILSSISFQVDATDLNVNPQPSASVGVSINLIDVLEEEETPISKVTKNAMISLECPYQASNGHLVYTLTPGDFGIPESNLATAEYVTYTSTFPFSVSSSTGQITVTSSSSLENQAKYFHWVLCRSTIGSVTTSKISLLRIDTFDMTSQMVVIEFAEKYSDVVSNIQTFRSRAQVFFSSTQRIGFSNIIDTSTSSRRRLLATQTAAYTYVVSDTQADDIANVNTAKSFLTDTAILKVLQQSSDGTPVVGLSDQQILQVATVSPYQESTSSDASDFVSSTGGIVMFCLLGLLLVAALVLLVVCLCHRKKRSDQVKLIKREEEKRKEKTIGFFRSQETSTPVNPGKKMSIESGPPGYSDIFVVNSTPPLSAATVVSRKKEGPRVDKRPTVDTHANKTSVARPEPPQAVTQQVEPSKVVTPGSATANTATANTANTANSETAAMKEGRESSEWAMKARPSEKYSRPTIQETKNKISLIKSSARKPGPKVSKDGGKNIHSTQKNLGSTSGLNQGHTSGLNQGHTSEVKAGTSTDADNDVSERIKNEPDEADTPIDNGTVEEDESTQQKSHGVEANLD
ncbi:protocadherin Fat 4-like [Physella acuta]|uniref:protocadherin Fat 4-like n=1 Tax=Physella acuta TaxID=109671 RepID=UPI0027DE9269|nr:protocadherin Fat 4-like [Physella acuta]